MDSNRDIRRSAALPYLVHFSSLHYTLQNFALFTQTTFFLSEYKVRDISWWQISLIAVSRLLDHLRCLVPVGAEAKKLEISTILMHKRCCTTHIRVHLIWSTIESNYWTAFLLITDNLDKYLHAYAVLSCTRLNFTICSYYLLLYEQRSPYGDKKWR